MFDEELDEALAELEETRATANRELKTLAGRRKRIERLEREKDALLDDYAALASEAPESREPAERHRVYRMLRLRVTVRADDSIELNGTFGGPLPVCESEPSWSSSRP